MSLPLSDPELRTLVRAAIARVSSGGPGEAPDPRDAFMAHASHLRLAVIRGGDDDGACLIEPAVRCNHCGYCQSYGH